MNPIEIEKATKRFGNLVAVDGLSLAVPEGAIYGFIGPNGSGKTTTLRLILRILLPDAGRIKVLGEESFGAANDRVGYLPEERGLYKKMKVLELLQFLAALKGRRDGRNEAKRWLDKLGLGEWGNKKVEALSKIEEGDKVIVVGQSGLKDKTPVRIVAERNNAIASSEEL